MIFYGATSADGYIARPDGDFKWLDRPRPAGNYGMGEFYKSIDTVVMGRKTFGGLANEPREPRNQRTKEPKNGERLK